MSSTAIKPVKLQVNDSGSWCNVIRFDAAHDMQCAEVLAAAEMLGKATQRVTFRIAIDDSLSTVLMRWSKEMGWVDA